VAFTTVSFLPLPLRRSCGTAISRAPDRYCPVRRGRIGRDLGRRAVATTCPPCTPPPARCRRRNPPRGSPPRHAPPRARCCPGRAGSSAWSAAGHCRAGAARWRARPAHRARRSAPSRSARPAGCAGSRRPKACRPRGSASGSSAHVHKESQPFADFLEDGAGDLVLLLVSCRARSIQSCASRIDICTTCPHAEAFAGDLHRQRLGLQPVAAAGAAGAVVLVALEFLADPGAESVSR
jgi:hypothetical protein